MNVVDDGRARQLSPLRCIFCEQYDAHRLDRFVGLPKSGRIADGSQIKEKVFTIPEMTDKLFENTDLAAYRESEDVNYRAAAAKLEAMTLQSLLSQHERLENESEAKLCRICFACWEGAEKGRRPPGLKQQEPYWLRKKN